MRNIDIYRTIKFMVIITFGIFTLIFSSPTTPPTKNMNMKFVKTELTLKSDSVFYLYKNK